MPHPRRGDRQRPTRRGSRRGLVEVDFALSSDHPLLGSAFNTASSASSCADPMYSPSREPRRDE
jgi:hypothetical protein